MDHKAEADKRYQQATEAVERHETTYADGASKAERCIALAHVAAVREQTEVQRQLLAVQKRIARQLERRDVAEIDAADVTGADNLAARGWVYLGVLTSSVQFTILMGRPRTLPVEGIDPRD